MHIFKNRLPFYFQEGITQVSGYGIFLSKSNRFPSGFYRYIDSLTQTPPLDEQNVQRAQPANSIIIENRTVRSIIANTNKSFSKDLLEVKRSFYNLYAEIAGTFRLKIRPENSYNICLNLFFETQPNEFLNCIRNSRHIAMVSDKLSNSRRTTNLSLPAIESNHNAVHEDTSKTKSITNYSDLSMHSIARRLNVDVDAMNRFGSNDSSDGQSLLTGDVRAIRKRPTEPDKHRQLLADAKRHRTVSHNHDVAESTTNISYIQDITIDNLFVDDIQPEIPRRESVNRNKILPPQLVFRRNINEAQSINNSPRHSRTKNRLVIPNETFPAGEYVRRYGRESQSDTSRDTIRATERQIVMQNETLTNGEQIPNDIGQQCIRKCLEKYFQEKSAVGSCSLKKNTTPAVKRRNIVDLRKRSIHHNLSRIHDSRRNDPIQREVGSFRARNNDLPLLHRSVSEHRPQVAFHSNARQGKAIRQHFSERPIVRSVSEQRVQSTLTSHAANRHEKSIHKRNSEPFAILLSSKPRPQSSLNDRTVNRNQSVIRVREQINEHHLQSNRPHQRNAESLYFRTASRTTSTVTSNNVTNIQEASSLHHHHRQNESALIGSTSGHQSIPHNVTSLDNNLISTPSISTPIKWMSIEEQIKVVCSSELESVQIDNGSSTMKTTENHKSTGTRFSSTTNCTQEADSTCNSPNDNNEDETVTQFFSNGNSSSIHDLQAESNQNQSSSFVNDSRADQCTSLYPSSPTNESDVVLTINRTQVIVRSSNCSRSTSVNGRSNSRQCERSLEISATNECWLNDRNVNIRSSCSSTANRDQEQRSRRPRYECSQGLMNSRSSVSPSGGTDFDILSSQQNLLMSSNSSGSLGSATNNDMSEATTQINKEQSQLDTSSIPNTFSTSPLNRAVLDLTNSPPFFDNFDELNH